MVLVPDNGTQLELRRRQGGVSPSAPPRPKPQVQSVPPILRRRGQNSMPGYSKGAQGLSVYVRVTGIFTGTTDSPSALRRQCPNRYAIRAGRNLPDKEFRYLRTVRLLLLPDNRGPDRFRLALYVAAQFGLSHPLLGVLRTVSGDSRRLAGFLHRYIVCSRRHSCRFGSPGSAALPLPSDVR